MSHSESGQSATRRFIDLFGEERLRRGAAKSERGRDTDHSTYSPFLDGKEQFILNALYSHEVFINPYLCGSNAYWAFRSGAGIERADLNDVVRMMS